MEQWKDIPGYEGIYQASTGGSIRTCANKITSNARYHTRTWKQRVLKQKTHPNKRGRSDARVSLWKNGKESTHLVSRLVAMTWCKGFAPGMTVNHIDGNPKNNCADNLEWVSRAENIRKGFDDGLYDKKQKPVSLRINDEVISFKSFAEASRYLNKNNGYLSGVIACGKRRACGAEIIINGGSDEPV